MHYVLVDTHGASLDAFAQREMALRAWVDLRADDPAVESDVAVLVCDDEGNAVDRVDARAEAAALKPY
ncbi:MAG: hypothetical protein QOJ97_2804 [Solirubrobacteraceae bacterium]|jgi:hypothetical protein|nr:hypothetical protein [Solirubrobacteraceae bacterium]